VETVALVARWRRFNPHTAFWGGSPCETRQLAPRRTELSYLKQAFCTVRTPHKNVRVESSSLAFSKCS
jgi:hypothetical protein